MIPLRELRRRPNAIGAESIREVVFGVEDGAVQNTTLVAGMVGAGLSGSVVLLAGAINAVAGVLSMSMGTYLSSKAERDVLNGTGRSATHDLTPGRDAVVMAAAYAAGALVPLLPFGLGALGRTGALAAAIVLTTLVLFVLGVAKAMLSHQSRIRSGLEMLTLASAAGLAGYVIGQIARAAFDLTV